jgi:hypothetical protein
MSTTEPDSDAVTTPTTDETFAQLTDVYRRRLLVALLSAPRVDPTEFVDDADDDAATRLAHVHLPKLDDAGFVDWTPRDDEVARGPRFDAVRPLLELLDENPAALPADWL